MNRKWMGIAAALQVFALAATAGDSNPVISASLSAKVSEKVGCDLSQCQETEKATFAASHSFNITAPQEAALLDDAEIEISVNGGTLAFGLAEDPNFQNGDTSVEVTKTVSMYGVPMPVTAQVSWGNGIFTISISGKGEEITAGPVMTAASEAETAGGDKVSTKGGGPDDNKLSIETVVENGGGLLFSVQTWLACDIKRKTQQQNSAEGAFKANGTYQAKSKSITTQPPIIKF